MKLSKSIKLSPPGYECQYSVMFWELVITFKFCPNALRPISVLQSHQPGFVVFIWEWWEHRECHRTFRWLSLSSQLNLWVIYIFSGCLYGVWKWIRHFLSWLLLFPLLCTYRHLRCNFRSFEDVFRDWQCTSVSFELLFRIYISKKLLNPVLKSKSCNLPKKETHKNQLI
jgi:hypothetical protein